MKKMMKLFVPVTAAVVALASCNQEIEQNIQPAEGMTIRVHASANDLKADDPETRTYIATYQGQDNTILWGTGEYMKLALASGEVTEANTAFGTSSEDSADAWNGDNEADFAFTITPKDANADAFTLMGLYPASAAVASSNTNPASYKVSLPSTQNATASSYDPAAYIMVAKPESFDAVQTDWVASFRRATALNKITLKNIPNGKAIKRVTITVPDGKYLAGARHINLTNNVTNESPVLGDIYSGGGRTETIEVKYATPLSGTGEGTWDADIWFTSWGVELVENDPLTIVAYTTDKKSYTKSITTRAAGIKFQEGYLNTLGANMSGIDPEDATELEDGDYVVLAKDGDNYYALKAEKEDGKERLLSVAYDGSLDSYNGDADMIWSLTKSGDSFIFENDSKYLGYKGSNNESYWLAADENWTETNYLLDVTAQQTAGLYYVTLHSNASRYLSKNSSSAFFAFYGNTSQKADIVFVPATVDNRTDVTLTFAESSFALTKGSTEYNDFMGQGVTASPNATAITDYLNWSYTNTDGVIDENNSSEYAIALSGETGTATVTVSFDGDLTYKAATASYTITVSDAGGPEYVLVSAANDVVAGDYIITWDNSYYLPSGSTSGTNPAVGTGITVANNKITNTVTSDMVWTFTGDNTNGFTISDGTNILHSTNTAQGISITTNSTRKWTASVDGTYGMLLRGDDGGTRNLAVYNSGSWRYYATGNNYSGILRLYKLDNSNVTPTVATPTFSFIPSGNKVSISCATDGATIYYTTNGDDPTTTSNVYSEAISLSGDQMTIKAFATKSSYDDSAIASTTYYAINRAATTNGSISAVDYAAEGDEITITVTPDSGYQLGTLSVVDGSDHAVAVSNYQFTMPASSVTVSATFATASYDFETIAELNALVTSTSSSYNGYLTDAVVSFVPATNTAIVKDATGSVMFYKSSHGLLQGQTYTGEITVTAIKYNSLYSEVTAWDASFSVSQTTVAPQSVTLAELTDHYDDYQNAYVQVSGLTVVSVSSKNINVTDGVNSYVVYDNPGTATCAAGDVITAVGTITKYQTTEELKVWAAADITITGSAPKAVTFTQPTGAAATAGCSIAVTVGGNPHTSGNTVASGTTVTLTATEGTDYEFTSWSVTGALVADPSASTTTFVMGTSAVSISANFTSTGGNQQTPTLQYTLTPASTGANSSPHNSYTAAATTTIDGIGWSVMGNSNMTPWRIGGKNISEVNRPIYSTTAISANISQIVITHGAASSITVNSMTVYVCSTAAGAAADTPTNVVASFTPTFVANGDVTINKADNTSWANCFYRIVYNVTVSGNTNRYVSFNEVKFYGTN